MFAHERDRPGCGHTIEDGYTGQGGTGASAATSTSDLHPFGRRALPGFVQRGQDVGPVGGQAEIWPAKPS